MSIVDKVIAAVTPRESEEARRNARQRARNAATAGDWLMLVLEHHERIEGAFRMVKEAGTAPEQIAAQKKVAVLVTARSIAKPCSTRPCLQ